VKPAERAAQGQPFVEVAEHNDKASSLLGKYSKQPVHLPAAFSATEPKMSDYDMYGLTFDI
jgi:hypothetical protein